MPLRPLCPGSIPTIFPASGLAGPAGAALCGSCSAGGLSGPAAGVRVRAPAARAGVHGGDSGSRLAGRRPQVGHDQRDGSGDRQRDDHCGRDQGAAASGGLPGFHLPQSVIAAAVCPGLPAFRVTGRQ